MITIFPMQGYTNDNSTGHFLHPPTLLQCTYILWVSLLPLSGLQVQSRPMLELGRKQGLNNSLEQNWKNYCSSTV